jgi:hypothetical protein
VSRDVDLTHLAASTSQNAAVSARRPFRASQCQRKKVIMRALVFNCCVVVAAANDRGDGGV